MKRLLLVLAAIGITSAQAEVPEVRIARQFSMGYLQLNVIDHEKLIQKHAAELGIPDVKVTTYKVNGPAAMTTPCCPTSLTSSQVAPWGC